jgi:uncharacterized protein (UPF0210 family)
MSAVTRPPVRTVTIGVADHHPLRHGAVTDAVERLGRAEAAYRAAGYEVQTLRLSTRPVLDDLADRPPAEIVSYARGLQSLAEDVGLAYLSLGPALAAHPGFPLERLAIIEDVLIGSDALSCTVQLATAEHGIRTEAALPTARIVQRLARGTDEGFGNFRFAALACVGPGHPFFPASYHDGTGSLAVGLQGASIVSGALRAGQDSITERVRSAMVATAAPVVRIARELAEEFGLRFGGIDLSPAPGGEDSIAAGFELCGADFGRPGTLAVAAALTEALRTTGLPTCGYNGLMLPVMEDVVLARRWAQGQINTHQLLCYSAVCGTGLDTVPLRGDTSADEIARLLLDVAALAHRLGKPLSARLFPVPGKNPGDLTTFTSPYLVNTRLT